MAPRDVLLDCFRRLPPPPAFIDDRDLAAVVVEGEDGRGPVTVRHDVTARPQRRPPLSAVARHTGFPPAIVADMILDGSIRRRGRPATGALRAGRAAAGRAGSAGDAVRITVSPVSYRSW